jgi:hypothetical protein
VPILKSLAKVSSPFWDFCHSSSPVGSSPRSNVQSGSLPSANSSPRLSAAEPRSPEQSDVESRDTEERHLVAGLMTAIQLMYEAAPRKNGFNSALEV